MSTKQRGLGRGLGALIDDFSASESTQTVTSLPLQKVEPNPNQPRHRFDEEELQALADSISEHGILQPLAVRKMEGGFYQIIAGERRWRASRMAGLNEVPVIVRDWDEMTRLKAALIENLQRDDLNPVEEALGIRALMDKCELTQEAASGVIGKSRSAIANSLRLLTLPDDVLALLKDGSLSAGHGRALVSVSPERQSKLAILTVQQGWSVRQLERICAQPEKKPVETPAPARRPAELGQLEKMAREVFGTRVKLDGDENKGKITLSYMSAEDLERIWDVLEFIRQSEQ